MKSHPWPRHESCSRRLVFSSSAGPISGLYYEAGHDFGPMLHFVFRFAHDPGQTPVAMPPEIGEVRWCDLDDLPGPISDFTENRIRDALGTGVTYRVVTERIWRA